MGNRFLIDNWARGAQVSETAASRLLDLWSA
jgi:hypothetical protein